MTLEDKAKEWWFKIHPEVENLSFNGDIFHYIDMNSFTNYLLYEAVNELTKTLSVSDNACIAPELFVSRTCVSCGKDYSQKDMICVAIRAEYWCMSCASIALELCKPGNHKEKNTDTKSPVISTRYDGNK